MSADPHRRGRALRESRLDPPTTVGVLDQADGSRRGRDVGRRRRDPPAGAQDWGIPDAIDAYTVGDSTCPVAADEGDVREWGDDVEGLVIRV